MPPSCDESSRAGRLCGLVEQTDGLQCKSDVVPASTFYKDNLGNISSFFFSFATSPGFLWKVQPQAYGLTGRFWSHFIPSRCASRAVSFTCLYIGAFFAHATFLRRQRDRSSMSGLAGLLSGWVPPVIRQSVIGREGRRRYVLCYFTLNCTWLGGPFYRSCLHGRCAHLTSPMGCRPVCTNQSGSPRDPRVTSAEGSRDR